MFEYFWDFDKLIEYGVPDEVEIAESRPTFGSFLGFWDNVTGMGCRPMGFSHV
jgi:hypothetical protein